MIVAKAKFLLLFSLVLFAAAASQDFESTDVTDNISLGDLSAYEDATSTIALWLYQESASGSTQDIFSKRTTGGTDSPNEMGVDSGTMYYLQASAGCGSWGTLVSVAEVVGVWVFYAGTNDGVTARLYKNGVEVGTDASPLVTVCDNASNVKFGNSDAGLPYDGRLAYVSFYNRALTATEVRQIMVFPGSISDGLVSFHTLMNSGNQNDLGQNNYDGTNTGAADSANGPPVYLSSGGQNG